MIQPVIMAGGNGSRLWPVSRQLNAKQFLTLTDDSFSMLQMTIARLDGVGSTSAVFNPVVQMTAFKQPVYCAQFPAAFQD